MLLKVEPFYVCDAAIYFPILISALFHSSQVVMEEVPETKPDQPWKRMKKNPEEAKDNTQTSGAFFEDLLH